jgi:predicted enzyme related to lactoylglutathione lyase
MIDVALLPNNKEQPMADNVRGRFVWHELVTPNGKGAHEFYSKAVGWKTQGWEQDSSYQMFVASTGPLGATVESRDGVPRWIPYVGTDDVDATAEAAKRLGATVATEPADIPNGGRYAILVDPNGATFGVHGHAGAPSPEKEPQYGEFSWHELATTVDPIVAFGFYRELFGWEDIDHYDMGPSGVYLLYGRNGTQVGGIFNKGAEGKPGPAYWLCYVRTKNVDKMVEDVKAARGMVLSGPMDVPGGHRIASFEDPHGAFFAGHTLAEDAKAAAAKPAAAAAKKAAAPERKPAARAEAVAPAKPATAAKTAAAPAAKPAPKPAPAKTVEAKPKPKPAKAKKKAAKKKAPKKKTPKKTAKKAKKAAKKRGKKVAKKKSARKAAKKATRKATKKVKRTAAKKKSGKPKKQSKGKRR